MRLTVADDFYSDIYSDIYGGAANALWLYVEIAFDSMPGESPVWTDVTQWVRSGSTKRGRSNEFDGFSAGTATVELDNRDRRFDPTYEDGPYYPNVKLRRRLRIRVTRSSTGVDYKLFTGYISAWPQEYRNPHDGLVQVTAVDALGVLGQQNVRHPFVQLDSEYGGVLDEALLAGPDSVVAESTGARIERVLAALDMPRSVDTGHTEVIAGQGTGNALQYLQKVAQTEDGRLFVSGDGVVTFSDRHAPFTTPRSTDSQATFGENDLRYNDITLNYDDDQIRNHIVIRTHDDGQSEDAQVSREDEGSIEEYLRHSYEREVLGTSTAEALADYLLFRNKEPFVRVESLDLRPLRDPDLALQALEREITDRVTVERRPQNVGDPIVQEALVEGVAHTFSAGDSRWNVSFNLSPADTQNYLILDDAELGLLDTALVGF